MTFAQSSVSPRRVRHITGRWLACLAGLVVLPWATAVCWAQEEPAADEPVERRPVYAPVGRPPEPKVEIAWNRFYDYAETTALLKKLAEAHPEFCRLESLGKSFGDREMWVMTLSDFEDGDADRKPAIWIDGGIHANEVQSVEVVLYTAWFLLENRERLERVGTLFKERTFYLMPMMSPDSRDHHFYEPNSTHTPRTGLRPVDDDRDGLVDEDGPNDLNNDGHITWMRKKDPNGQFKPHPDFPALMVRVNEGEQGSYTLLGPEGYDVDGDGQVNEDGPGNYDPNRDWPWNWEPGYVQRGAHRYPFSILENRMVGDFIQSRPNIAAAQSYHNTGGMILMGPGAAEDRYQPDDVAIYTRIGRRGERMLPGYKLLNIAKDLYTVYGGELDWLYQMQGIYAFTNELHTPFNFYRQQATGFFARDELLHEFSRDLLLGDGVVPWEEVEHPEYGTIEVGGLKKNWPRQPPSFLLEEECHRNMAFTLYHAGEMPLVDVRSIDVRQRDDGLWEITAVVGNRKLQPTRAAVDVRHKISRPDQVTLTAEGLTVVTAMWADDLVFRNPTLQTRKPQVVELPSIPGQGVRHVRWLAAGEPPAELTVSIDTVKGGQDQQTWTKDE